MQQQQPQYGMMGGEYSDPYSRLAGQREKDPYANRIETIVRNTQTVFFLPFFLCQNFALDPITPPKTPHNKNTS